MARLSDPALLLVAGLAISLLMHQLGAVKFDLKNQCGNTGGKILGPNGLLFRCGGQLNCRVSGAVPATLAEYTQSDQDYYDVSLVDGFNVPLSINPTNSNCTAPACKADVNAMCPDQFKVDGGCKSACNVFQTDQYCCTGAFADNCPATNYSMIFKNQCPQAYSYPKDDNSSTFTCPSGTSDYSIVFCP
ncbi:hypothetical protein SUGI_0860220 [Cryptomeria japonica]|nr:hypothetical protein SUGI_0860220 [Cryptomeria japonica]